MQLPRQRGWHTQHLALYAHSRADVWDHLCRVTSSLAFSECLSDSEPKPGRCTASNLRRMRSIQRSHQGQHAGMRGVSSGRGRPVALAPWNWGQSIMRDRSRWCGCLRSVAHAYLWVCCEDAPWSSLEIAAFSGGHPTSLRQHHAWWRPSRTRPRPVRAQIRSVSTRARASARLPAEHGYEQNS